MCSGQGPEVKGQGQIHEEETMQIEQEITLRGVFGVEPPGARPIDGYRQLLFLRLGKPEGYTQQQQVKRIKEVFDALVAFYEEHEPAAVGR
jgi:hypothetical protein